VPVPMLMPALAYFFLPVSVLMLMRVPVPFCHRVRGFGATYILVLVGFQDPVSGVACACLDPRFRDFQKQTAWPLCTSVRSAIVLEGCHSMVTFAVTNTCGVCSRGSGDRLHGLSALQLALLSCSKDVTQCDSRVWRLLKGFWRQTTWPLCTSARFAIVATFA